jgi:hypothetical protein
MKRRYEVAYYECGLTRRISRKFFTALFAYLYKGYVEYKLGDFGKVEIKQI